VANVNTAPWHGIDWIGFKSRSTGAERDYLYITTGDGGLQADNPNFTEEGQDLNSVRGKVLRIDLAAEDAYPNDPARNYGFPATNPSADDVVPMRYPHVAHLATVSRHYE